MAESTVLQMVQNILSRLSSDEVNSISDTTESMQIATILQNKYYDIVSRGSFEEHSQLFQLNPSNDPTKPTLMFVPQGVSRIEWLKYYDTNPDDSSTTQSDQFGAYSKHDVNVDLQNNSGNTPGSGTTAPGYIYVTILGITQFLEMINRFDPTQSNVGSWTFDDANNNYPNNFTFLYLNDRQPKWCTVLSNAYVIFDAYDSTQDTTLQASKTMGYGEIVPVFQLQDNFVPDLDDQQFPLLMNEATALAFYELKQQPHALVDRELKRQWAVAQKTKSFANKPGYFDQLPSFGRRIGSGGYAVGYPFSYTHQSASFF